MKTTTCSDCGNAFLHDDSFFGNSPTSASIFGGVLCSGCANRRTTEKRLENERHEREYSTARQNEAEEERQEELRAEREAYEERQEELAEEMAEEIREAAYKQHNPGDYICPTCQYVTLRHNAGRCPTCRADVPAGYWERVRKADEAAARRREEQEKHRQAEAQRQAPLHEARGLVEAIKKQAAERAGRWNSLFWAVFFLIVSLGIASSEWFLILRLIPLILVPVFSLLTLWYLITIPSKMNGNSISIKNLGSRFEGLIDVPIVKENNIQLPDTSINQRVIFGCVSIVALMIFILFAKMDNGTISPSSSIGSPDVSEPVAGRIIEKSFKDELADSSSLELDESSGEVRVGVSWMARLGAEQVIGRIENVDWNMAKIEPEVTGGAFAGLVPINVPLKTGHRFEVRRWHSSPDRPEAPWDAGIAPDIRETSNSSLGFHAKDLGRARKLVQFLSTLGVKDDQNATTRSQSPQRTAKKQVWKGERLPDTRLLILEDTDLSAMSLSQVQAAINEMFARHGATFGDDEVQAKFASLPWYRPRPDVSMNEIEKEFSRTEKANLQLLGDRRKELSESPSDDVEFPDKAVIDDPDGYTNLRSGPSAIDPVVAKIEKGEVFHTRRENGDWWRVRTKTGILGFMHRSRIKILAKDSKQSDSAATTFQGERYATTRIRLLTNADLSGMDSDALRYAINELFARHGAEFGKDSVSSQFSGYSWYRPRPGVSLDDIEAKDFTDTERANLKILAQARTLLNSAQPKQAQPGNLPAHQGTWVLHKQVQNAKDTDYFENTLKITGDRFTYSMKYKTVRRPGAPRWTTPRIQHLTSFSSEKVYSGRIVDVSASGFGAKVEAVSWPDKSPLHDEKQEAEDRRRVGLVWRCVYRDGVLIDARNSGSQFRRP